MPFKDPETRNAYAREWVARRRAEFFDGKVCAICGGTEKLELDHVDPALKVNHRIWSWREERRLEELAKCQVLCERCHRERHDQEMREERGNGTLHGTLAGYKDRGCRCEICVTAVREMWNEQNRRKRAL